MASFPNFPLDQSRPQTIPFRNFVTVDGQPGAGSGPVALFNPDPKSHPGLNVIGMGIGIGEVWADPRWRRGREQDAVEGSGSQVTSIDFLQSGVVSTGLGLSLDDRRVAVTSSGESVLGLRNCLLDESLELEMHRQEAEIDRFMKIECERMRQQILEKVRGKNMQTLACVEEKLVRKMRDKEAEIDVINRKNSDLEEQIKQLNTEINGWQHRAKYNESMITQLKYHLQQSQTNPHNRDNKEGCGDSEVDDTASCCNGAGAINFQLLSKESKDMRDLMTCKACRANPVSMLLLPCHHVCLCKECESKFSYCPICQSAKLFGTEVYM